MNTTEQTVELIRAHTVNNSQVIPDDINVQDKLFLLAEIDRLQKKVEMLEHEIEMFGVIENVPSSLLD